MHTDYRYSAIRDLRDQELHFASRERRLAAIRRAEDLLIDADAATEYPCVEVHRALTCRAPQTHLDDWISGQDLRHDLQLLVDDLSDSVAVAAEAAGQRVLTIAQLAKELNVSAKTISRWRRLGLVSRRFLFDGRKRLGFLQSSVDRFVARNRIRVLRGSQFSQLTDEEREAIIRRGRALAQAGHCPAAVTRQLSQEAGRSAETIRYTLRHFDQAHPDEAIFPGYHGPLRDETKWKIYQLYRRGESAVSLAQRFYRTKKGIRRVVAEMRARRIGELPLGHIPNDQFALVHSKKEEKQIVRAMPRSGEPARKLRAPADLPAYLASLYKVPLLTREQEAHLFRKMNYLKYRAGKLREKLDPARPQSKLMNRIEKLYDEAVATKNQVVCANLRLVVSIAKRRVGAAENFFELVSDGNMSLIRAVERFDFARGNKFSTYASWAIMKNFSRSIPDEYRHHDRFRTSHGETFSATEDCRSSQYDQETAQTRRESQVETILGGLDAREKEIVIRRFGLDRQQSPLTLKQVGAKMGVTKERVRQLESRALQKLRRAAEQAKIEFFS
jgi:RNA polymerase primary sigma factor/RNA polymerase sigma factor